MRWVGLLRGVNLGPRNRVAMAGLRAMFEAAGAADVSTYIASGNVLFTAPDSEVAAIGSAVERELKAASVKTWLVFRSADQLDAVVKRNPFPQVADGKHLHVSFLLAEPDPVRLAALDPSRSPPDTVRVLGQELWLHTPNGLADTMFDPNYLDKVLGTAGTMRNWNTVLELRKRL
jgi:uncharacterized protein (DUF1697 family)